MTDLEMDEKELRSHIAAFETALEAKEMPLEEPPLRRILLALDGSNQDPPARRLAAALARRAGAVVLPLCPWREGEPGLYLAEQTELLEAEGIEIREVEEADEGPSYERILTAARIHACDLIVVPAPFREDFAQLGSESVGSNLDLLLCRTPVPLLVVREPQELPEETLRRVVLPVTPALAPHAGAAGWALRLVAAKGEIRLLGVVDRELLERLGATGVATEEAGPGLPAFRRPEVAGLVAALQRRAAEAGLDCRVDLRTGEEVRTVAEESNAGRGILVLPCCPRDPSGTAFQQVHALIRASRNPVLMV